MYEAFYGLTSKPFQLNPDPQFYFPSKQHRRAAAYLEYGMHQNEGFIVITGEVGAGKTTIVRHMLDGLDEDRFLAAQLVSTQIDAEDTLRLVGAAFGIRTKDVEKADVLMSLEAYLISMTSKGKRCLLIVDEAQNLTSRAVEELRMLSNFQYGNHALLQSFLIGQPEFRNILQSPQMTQFRQRVIASSHIGPMDVEETRGYVEHRLKCAGSNGCPTFTPDSFEAIFKATSGIPRRINSLCDRLLLSGFLNDKKEFDVSDVDTVADEIFEETQGRSSGQSHRSDDRAAEFESTTASGERDIAAQPPKPTRRRRQSAAPALDLGGSPREDLTALLEGLNAWQFNERLGRLEHSLQQLEVINGTTLSLLQRIVSAVAPEDGLLPKEHSSTAPDDPAKAKSPKKPAVAQKALPFTAPEGEVQAFGQSATANEDGCQATQPLSAIPEAELAPTFLSATAPPAVSRTKRSKQRFRRKIVPTTTQIGERRGPEQASGGAPENTLLPREPE